MKSLIAALALIALIAVPTLTTPASGAGIPGELVIRV